MNMTTSYLIFIFGLLLAPSAIAAYRITRDVINENNLEGEDTRKNTLRQVNLIMRHGHRNPHTTYPNDPYKNDPMEPYGWGQLTNKGRQSQYNQGLFLRDRYGDFLGTKYSPSIFWLQSTAADRAKMSALLEAAALWQPNTDQTFKSDLNWQPVVLNYQTIDVDNLLLVWTTCPEYTRQREKALKTREIQAINEANKDFYSALSEYTGSHITNPHDVFDLYSTLNAEETQNYRLPNWTNEFYPEKMKPLSRLSLKLSVYSEDMLKMKGAPLITKIAHSMIDKSRGTIKPPQRKMFMYVGHDSTIVNVLEGMKIWDMQIPDFSMMHMIELHENEEGYNVQMYLRNSTRYEPFPLTLPGCSFECPLNQFAELLKPMIISEEEWKQVCELKDPNYVPGEELIP